MSDRTEQGRALVKLLSKAAWRHDVDQEPEGCPLVTMCNDAADTLSWALDRIAALEGALRPFAESCVYDTPCVEAGRDRCVACLAFDVLTPQPAKENA